MLVCEETFGGQLMEHRIFVGARDVITAWTVAISPASADLFCGVSVDSLLVHAYVGMPCAVRRARPDVSTHGHHQIGRSDRRRRSRAGVTIG